MDLLQLHAQTARGLLVLGEDRGGRGVSQLMCSNPVAEAEKEEETDEPQAKRKK